ncbi:MAG: gamma carbonic anhydrase family protein [Proteobacteria bacterium]|nr:gamma carbonic anhydrase family protein [Pseudomonadota bacterium]
MPIILPYKGVYPSIAPDAFIAQNAVVIGDVEIGSQASIWYNCVLRGDVHHIKVGARSNIQDGTIVHVHRNNGPTIIGDGVTIGHMVLLHACNLGDQSFIGMGAKIIDHAVVQPRAMVAAGAVVTPNQVIQTGELWAGVPAKLKRMMTEAELRHLAISEANYVELAAFYLQRTDD